MKIYTVGGAVRDELLGLPVKDRDFVVVGATPEEMERRGFKPVGKDFPVFLHPDSPHEEYALARTERKTAPGYKGFIVHAAPDVTLEDDLLRRDLTINAMARDEDGHLIDPYGGAADLRARLLRHVGPAFVEDPVRILRVARFAARFGFAIAAETMTLMQRMAAAGEVDHLVAERVWQEIARGLMEPAPGRMIGVLAESGALDRILPGCPQAGGTDARAAVDCAAARSASLEERFAAWLGGVIEAGRAQALAERLRASNECRELLVLTARLRARVLASAQAGAEELTSLLREADAFRRPARFGQLLAVCGDIEGAADARHSPRPWRARLEQAQRAAGSVDAAAVAARAGSGVAEALFAARVEAVRLALDAGDR
jgi:tRNA nucleotidyltransferase (CCA-adding enzyme)